MNIAQLVKQALTSGVFLYVENNELKFKLTVSTFPESLKNELKAHKSEIIEFLTSQADELFFDKPELTICERSPLGTQLSYAQNRIWFVNQSVEHSVEYNMQALLEVSGDFSVTAAQLAFQSLIARHEVLRTVYTMTEQGVRQKVLSDFNFFVAQKDLSAIVVQDKSETLQQLVVQDFNTPFDLASDLMLRATHVVLNDNSPYPNRLILNVHHIASDGWSQNILLTEFLKLYRFHAFNEAPQLAPLAIQYSDYACWQRSWLTHEVLEQQLSYWTNHLDDVPMVHNLPLDFPRPKVKSHDADEVTGLLSTELAQLLDLRSRELNMTPFMLIHAAFSLVLSKHSNTNDIIIGTPVANRADLALNPLIGFFANTVILRVSTDFKDVKEYLRHVRDVNLGAQSNQDAPFEQIVEKCSIPRNPQHTPLFQIMLEMDNTEKSKEPADSIFRLNDNNHVAAKFDLELSVDLHEQGGTLKWLFDESLFVATRINKLNKHFVNLLESMLKALDAPLAALPMLTGQEVKALYGFNQNQSEHISSELLAHELFEMQANKMPHNIAVEFQDSSMSYQELDEKANQLAHFLEPYVKGGDTLIGLCIERSFNMWIAILGILKAGAGYVPLDPSLPQDRIMHMLRDAQLEFLLASSGALQKVSIPQDIKVVNLDSQDTREALAGSPISKLTKQTKQLAFSPAYVIYTSGSTGKPKGIVQTHLTVSNLVQGIAYQDNVGEALRTLQLSSSSFDISVQESFIAWLTGGTLVLISEEEKADLYSLPKLLAQRSIGRLFMTPAVLNWMAGALALDNKQLPELRHISVAGDTLILSEEIRQFLRQHRHCKLWNQYGPSESHVMTSCEIKATDKKVSIGKVIPNTELYILGSDGTLLPEGTAGEAYIGGACLAEGYLNNFEMTQDKFIEYTFTDGQQMRLYRSGDIVRYTGGGALEFIERIDHQVKIRGFRVELGEVEEKLNGNDWVSSNLVLTKTDNAGHKHLIAYVHPVQEYTADKRTLIDELKTHLKQSLPYFMLPSVIIILDEWPRTTNGKVDKNALPEPDMLANQGVFIAPDTLTEEKLAQLWASLLGLPESQIGSEANFFESGGHSLLSIQLLTSIKKIWKVELNIQHIFEASKLSELAKLIDDKIIMMDQTQTLFVSESNKSQSIIV